MLLWGKCEKFLENFVTRKKRKLRLRNIVRWNARRLISAVKVTAHPPPLPPHLPSHHFLSTSTFDIMATYLNCPIAARVVAKCRFHISSSC